MRFVGTSRRAEVAQCMETAARLHVAWRRLQCGCLRRQHGFTHQLLCNRLTPPDSLPQQPLKTLQELIAEIELKVVCDLCVIRVKDITYKLQSVVHKCSRKLLLAKGKASEVWRPVSERPTGGHMGPNVHYKVCNFYVEGSGCPQHVAGSGMQLCQDQ
ncbi:Helicase with zinc finger domain 2 [Oryzias melastigma]|uniref:Helicase with zinc finger domain 2 n=1 Tax=Oryzias melastigma TaxID=30732 RepID=A0A834FEZ7_ORYME|nr:Helicase with zinc finger domain 2 [Oryzias melastigma]